MYWFNKSAIKVSSHALQSTVHWENKNGKNYLVSVVSLSFIVSVQNRNKWVKNSSFYLIFWSSVFFVVKTEP